MARQVARSFVRVTSYSVFGVEPVLSIRIQVGKKIWWKYIVNVYSDFVAKNSTARSSRRILQQISLILFFTMGKATSSLVILPAFRL